MTTQQGNNNLKASEQLKQTLTPRLVTWLMLLFNSHVTHADISNKMCISYETSRVNQKRVSAALNLPWGRQKIPHIMAHVVQHRLIHWLLLIAVTGNSLIGHTENANRIKTNNRIAQRIAKTRRKEDHIHDELNVA